MVVRRPDGADRRGLTELAKRDQGLQVRGKTGCRTGAPEIGTNVIIATALGNRLPDT